MRLFALITGIGNVKDSKTGRTATISRAKTITIKTTLCGLDRIDNNKGYSKINCRWVDSSAQNLNKRPIQKAEKLKKLKK